MSGPPLTAVVADDQPLFRAGLAGALGHHLNILAQAGDGRRALELVREHRPDLAILELSLPGLDGLGVLAALRREGAATKVLLLGAAFAEQDVRRAVGLGAAGLATKQADAGELIDAVLAIGRGELVLDARVEMPGDRNGHLDRHNADKPLTTREEQVLRLMADGLSGPQMARELVVSPSTIKSHVENLYAKLGVSHRGAAVAEGMRRGLLS